MLFTMTMMEIGTNKLFFIEKIAKPAELVVFCNTPGDNPFMAGAFCRMGEPEIGRAHV